MPKPTHRLERVAELLQRELAILLLNEIDDPRTKGVTLTTVKLSPDLRHARIYFTTLDDSRKTLSAYALNHAVSYLRRRIADTIELRVVPELYFVYDDELRDAEHLAQVLNSLPSDDTKE